MKKLFLLLLPLLFCLNSYSQNYQKHKPYTWMIGVEWNFMIDGMHSFANFTDIQHRWNILPYPTSLNLDFYLLKGMSIDFLASYSQYSSGDIIGRDTLQRGGMALAFDLNFKYNFDYLMFRQVFDPFVYVGIGYTGREIIWPQNMLSANIGVGFNWMIVGGFGIQWRMTAKVGLLPEVNSAKYDYLQMNAGIIYKFNFHHPVNRGGFEKKKYNWFNKKHHYKGNKGM